MTEFRHGHCPAQNGTTHRFLIDATASASVANDDLQIRLAALAKVLAEVCGDEQPAKARAEYDRAVQAARQAVHALRDIQRVLGDKRALISGHVRDAEELVHALALFDDGCELNSSHHGFAAAISTAHARTARARAAAIHQLMLNAQGASPPLRAPAEPPAETSAAHSRFSRSATA